MTDVPSVLAVHESPSPACNWKGWTSSGGADVLPGALDADSVLLGTPANGVT